MKFAAYLKRDPLVDRDVLPDAAAARCERELSKGATLADLVALGPEVVGGLSAAQLHGVVDSYHRYKGWRARAVELSKRLESVEREVVGRTTTAAQLSALDRGLKLCAAARVEAKDRSLVLSTCLELWNTAVTEVRRHGQVRCVACSPDHPSLEQYADYVERGFELEKVKPYKWLAMRRAELEGVLKLELEPGEVDLVGEAGRRRDRFGLAARDRTDESLFRELVGDDIATAVLAELDTWAHGAALRSAANVYTGLLSGRPLKEERVGAVFLSAPSKPVGVAVLDGGGDVLDSLELDPGERGWIDRAVDVFGDARVRHVVVPSDTASSKRLAELQARLGSGTSFEPVRPAAMSDGRGALEGRDRELPRAVQDAVVLGRRAINPLESWGAIDPVRTGVGEYQTDLDEELLREILEAARVQARRDAARRPPPPQVSAPGTQAIASMVRSVAELREGMTLAGTISNITGFGAFVSLGLEYEGMIHVSELADHFVDDPAEVVKIGQKVTARVLGVDRQRRRISLSLRSPNEDRRGARGGGSSRSRGAGGATRSKVLRDLDNLFKK